MSSDCIFCKIIAGEIPSHKIYEDEHSFAFLDINPLADGHVMVIPKAHHEQIEDLDPALAGKLFETTQRISAHVRDKFNAPATTIGINNGKAAGQVVPHLHIHIVPRFDGDGGAHIHSIMKGGGEKSLEEVAELLKM